MAILGIQETFRNRVGSNDDQRNREYTRTFDIFTSDRREFQTAVLATTGLPRIWDPYTTVLGAVDLGSWCRRVVATQDTVDPYMWRAEANYSSRIERPDINQVENPLLRPADISYRTTSVQVVQENDIDGFAITNTAGDKFDPPCMGDDDRLVITITRNQASYSAIAMVDYKGAVNSAPWFGFPAGQVRCSDLSADRAFENGIYFFRAMHQFEVRGPRYAGEPLSEVWCARLLNQGYRELIYVPSGTAGPSPPTDADQVGGAAWVDPLNALADDGSSATITLAAGEDTSSKLYVFGFGWSVGAPPNTPKSMKVEIGFSTIPNVDPYRVQTLRVAPYVGSSQTQGPERSVNLPSDGTIVFGAVDDNWLEGWPAADINDATWGILIWGAATESNPGDITIEIDWVKVTLYYGASRYSLRNILDKRTMGAIAKPALLNEAGRELGEGENPCWVVKTVRRQIDFNTLLLP